jgi:sigma-B regulation protein RsbU (phosphoserine phosphatase)
MHFLQHSFLPKFVLFLMIAVICTMIAERGRLAIYAQKAETEKTERLATELNLASDIQTNVLPNIFPVYPERKEFSLHASMTAAKEVGGDFYDFFFVDDDHIALVMADVSGKGIPAALFMMVARTLIKNRAMMGGGPAEILYDVNNQLCEGNVAELFVTVWLGILEISTGKGMAANAGHEHPVLCKNGDEFALVVYRHSPAVAAMEGMRFKEHEFEMKPGDTLFVYTDGVAEATNAENELFGTDRMLDALNKDPDAAPEQILENVMDGINEFVQGAEQFDDITMLSLKYFGAK